MASTLAGSIVIPSLEMIWPSNLPLSTPKIDFLGLREMPYSLHLWKIVLKCWICCSLFLEMVVRSSLIYLYKFPDQIPESIVHGMR
jgi:hypothetical protein